MDVSELEFVDSTTAAAQRWHRRVARSGIVRVAVIVVAVLAVVSQLHAYVDTRARKARLLREAEADRAAHPAAAQQIDLLDRMTLELANQPFAPAANIGRDALDALVRRRGLYLRALDDEVRSARAIHSATRVSRKDTFLACLLAPPTETTHAAIHRAAIKYRWRVDLDTIAAHVLEAELLDAGFRVAAMTWLEEVRRTTDATALRLLDHEREARTAGQLRRSVDAARAEWIAVVVDELPTGFAHGGGPALSDALRTSMLDDVLPVPHAARVVIAEAPSGRVLLRARVMLDARDVVVPNALADAEDIQGCQAALGARAALAN